MADENENYFATYGREPLHANTQILVARFAHALALKLLKSQHKYGWSDNWARSEWEAECRAELVRHIEKGDPLDVAAFCAFMFHHGWSTSNKE